MGTEKENKKIVGFHIQVIKLTEAQSMAAVGGGNYAWLTASVMKTINTLQPDESFVFGFPKGKDGESLDVKEYKDILISLNSKLIKGGFGWKVIYASHEKLFTAIPRSNTFQKKYSKKIPLEAAPKFEDQRAAKLIQLARDVFKCSDFTGGDKEARRMRVAICKAGILDLGLKLNALTTALGISDDGIWKNAHEGVDNIYVGPLREAAKGIQ